MPLDRWGIRRDLIRTGRSLESAEHPRGEPSYILRAISSKTATRKTDGADNSTLFPSAQRVLVDAKLTSALASSQ